jgi:hypothetical protein
MEACASSHYWGRELSRLGHEVRLIPPAYVKQVDGESRSSNVLLPTVGFGVLPKRWIVTVCAMLPN